MTRGHGAHFDHDSATGGFRVVRDESTLADAWPADPPATSTEPARVLVVGEDPDLGKLMCATLRFAGYDVHTAVPGANAHAAAEEWRPALMAQDGFHIQQSQHGRGEGVPAVFLTPGDQLIGRLPGLTVGGGDYLPKPFSPEELLARVRAVLRRAHVASGEPRGDGVLRFADLELVEDTCDVRRAGRMIQLTPTEFQLLRYLMRNTEKLLTRIQILEHVWPYDYVGDPKVVEAYMSKLRRKIDQAGPRLIHTLRARGYILRSPHGR